MEFQDWIKSTDTSDESLPSDAPSDAGVDMKQRQRIMGGRSTSSTHSDDRSSKGTAGKRRRIALLAGFCGIVVVGITICISVALGIGAFDKKSSSEQEQQGFDFDGVNSGMPSDMPSFAPTARQSLVPTMTVAPSVQSSMSPSQAPTGAPTATFQPSSYPTEESDGIPSSSPTYFPTSQFPPVERPPVYPMDIASDTLMTFCVIADVPYDQDEEDALPNQIATQMDGCEFLVHLGDLFNGDTFCDEEYYHAIRDIMLESKVPTFVIVGDNEWNDCQRDMIEIGWQRWVTNFMRFENYWNHNYTVVRQPGYEENFYFIHKKTLIIGLNIVGGRVHNSTEWSVRLESGFEWLRNVMDLNLLTGNAEGVIIMSHANPSADHLKFTIPFRNYVANELQNKYPILYLHGDGHNYIYTPHFLRQPNLLRIQHEGGVNEPILKIKADPSAFPKAVYNAFQVDRQLELMTN